MGGGLGPNGTGDDGICGAVKLGCCFMAGGAGVAGGGVGCVTTGERAFPLFWVGKVMTGLGGACGGKGAGTVGGGGGGGGEAVAVAADGGLF